MSDGTWSDPVLQDIGADALDRGPFVEVTARLLHRTIAGGPSVVAALVGLWGSGKSSTLAFITHRLEELDDVVVRINPWVVSGPEAVVAEVVTAVTAALDAAGVPPAVVKASRGYFWAFVRTTLKGAGTIGGAVADQQGVPIGADLGTAAGDVLSALAENAGRRAGARSAPATLQQASEALSTALQESGEGMLVVVDDVDRLQPDELLALFKAVRLLGRLPHVHYVLAYDEETLLDLLSQTPVANGRRDRALAYLEKMVPLRMEQPEITQDHLDDLITDSWVDLCDDLLPRGGLAIDLAHSVESELLLRRVLTTPRVVHRYYHQLRLTAELVGATTVDLVDLAVLTLLRLHHPSLYRGLSAERGLLTGRDGASDSHEQLSARIDALLSPPRGTGAREWRAVTEAVQRLFPLVADADMDSTARLLPLGGRSQRAQDPDYVDRYFALSPLAGDVHALDAAEALVELADHRTEGAAAALLAALTTDEVHPRAVAGARRLLRGLTDVVTAQPGTGAAPVGPEGAATAVVRLCAAAPLPSTVRSDASPAAAVLIGHLLVVTAGAPAPDWEELVARVVAAASARRETVAALLLLVRAFDTGIPVGSAAVVEGLRPHLADAAWEQVLASAAAGHDAAVSSVDRLGAWSAVSTSSRDLGRKMASAVAGGVDLLDLVSRLVPVRPSGADPASGAVVLTDDPGLHSSVVNGVGAAGLLGAPTPEELQSVIDARTDDYWGARRRAAAAVLRAGAGQRGRSASSGEPIPSDLSGATVYESAAVTAVGEADLRLLLTVGVPALPLPLPPFHRTAAGAEEHWSDRWEARLLEATKGSPAAQWLGGRPAVTPSWSQDHAPGHRATFTARMTVVSPRPEHHVRDSEPERRAVFVQAVPGWVSDSEPGVVVITAVGLRLRRLAAEPDSRSLTRAGANENEVVPASLDVLAEALLALVRSAPLAADALSWVPRAAAERAPSAVLHLAVSASAPLVQLVDLSRFGEPRTSGSSQHLSDTSTTENLDALDAAHGGTPGVLHVQRLLGVWLRELGYRDGVDAAVREATIRASHNAQLRDTEPPAPA